MSAFHEYTNTPCGRFLARAEAGLARPLEHGEMADVLLDNFMTLADSDEAHQIRDSVLVVFGRSTLGVIPENERVSASRYMAEAK